LTNIPIDLYAAIANMNEQLREEEGRKTKEKNQPERELKPTS